jgi:hypothetical protein
MPLLLCLFWLKASAAPFSGAPVPLYAAAVPFFRLKASAAPFSGAPVPFYAAAVPYYALLCALTAEG